MFEALKDLFERFYGEISFGVFAGVVIAMLAGQIAAFFTHIRPNGVWRKIIQYLGNFDTRKPENQSKEYGVKKAEV
jgi:hypothetical protein